MASYHLEASIIGRSAGKSALGAAAYRSGTSLTDPVTGTVFDFGRKGGILESMILAPAGAPPWVLDRQSLWAAVEAKENRKNSRFSREIIIALPHELSVEECIELVREWVRANFVEAGMVADISIHDPKPRNADDAPNRHAHIMLTVRELDSTQADGWSKNKNRTWNTEDALLSWRETWATAQNLAFAERGLNVQVDHRTLEAQRAEAEAAGDEIAAMILSRPPEPRLGVVAGNLEAKGVITDRGEALREARLDRARLEELALQHQSIAAEIEALESSLAVVEPEVVRSIADSRDRTRIAVERQLVGMGLEQFEISVAGGDRPNVRLMTQAEILADLPRLKRANKAGYNIYIRGPRHIDHDLVLLDDIDAFTAKRMIQDGLAPAFVAETSPTNYQAWFKLEEPVSAELRREAAVILAHRYGGDAAAADGHQSGRLAGFTNSKPEYRRADGRSPFVKVHSYAGKVATAARELLEAARAALARRLAPAPVAVPSVAVDADLLAWWQAGHDAAPTGSSLSEVDWHLAHRALGSGFSVEAVAAALEATAGRKGAHAHDYAVSTASKAAAQRQEPSIDDDPASGPSF